MRSVRILLTTIIILQASSAAGWTGFFGRFIENVPHEKYKGGPQVWDIERDSSCYIFFAAGLELSVWDGIRWSSYPTGMDAATRSLEYDPLSGRIYAAGDNFFGYWSPDRFGDFYFMLIYKNRDLSHDDIFRRAVYAHGVVYFQTGRKIIAYDPAEETIHTIISDEDTGYLLPCGKELYTQIDGKIYRLKRTGYEETGIELPDQAVYMECNGEGRLIFATEKSGILVHERGVIRDLNPATNRFLGEMQINCAERYGKDGYLVGTLQDGAYILDGGGNITDRFTERTGLRHTSVLSLEVMADGSLWFGLDGGIAHIADNPNERYHNSTERNIGNVYASIIDGTALYAATNKGIFLIRDNRTEKLIPGTQGRVLDMLRCGEDIIAVHSKGLMRLAGENPPTLLTADCWRVEPWTGREDLFLVSDRSGLAVYRIHDGHFSFSHRLEGYNVSRSIARVDKFGNIWINGFQRNVRRLAADKEQRRVTDDRMYAIPDADKQILMFMLDGDVVFNAGDRCYTYDPQNDSIVPNEYYTRLCRTFGAAKLNVFHASDAFFNYGEDHIAVIRRNGGELSEPIRIFEGINFKSIPERFRLFKLADEQTVAVGYTDGVAFYFLNTYDEKPRCSNIALRRIEYSLRDSVRRASVKDAIPHVKLPHGSNRIKFYFTGITRYRGFAYSLNGSPLQMASPGEYFEISRLSAGRHTIEVHSEREKQHPLILTVEIDRHFSSAWWFVWLTILCLSGLLLSGRFLYLRRILNIERRQQTQQQIACQNELLSQELRNRDRKLMSFTINGISINGMLDEMEKELTAHAADNPQLEAKIVDLRRRIAYFRRNDGNWKAFEIYFNSLYDGFLDKLSARYPQLTKNDLKICACIKLGMTTRETAAIMNISIPSVESARYRLRKHLGLSPTQSIGDFLAGI